jgi:hypothetical protein
MASALFDEHVRLSSLPEGPVRNAALRDLLALWLRPLSLEAVLCPECGDNRGDRERGRLDLRALGAGASYVLERKLPDPAVPVVARLQSVPLPKDDLQLTLPTGSYRLSWLRDGASTVELDFDSAWEAPRARLSALPPLATLIARLVACPGGELSLEPAGGHAPLIASVPPFRILPRCVTWGELAATLGRQRVDELIATWREVEPAPAGAPEVSMDAPAIVRGELARDYASVVGARLPDALELRAARALLDVHAGGDARLQSEWTGTPAEADGRSRLIFLRAGLSDDAPWPRWTEPEASSALRSANGFRLVVSGDR